MLLNLDGTVTFQCGETEIGQGADTAYAQMVAEAVGLASYRDVHVKSCQDTDIIYGIDALRGVSLDEEENLRIGSLTSFSHITRDPLIQKYCNVLGEAVDQVGSPQIRSIGTIGDSTCNGVTSADSASTLHAYEAIAELTGKNGVRNVPIKGFHIKAGSVNVRLSADKKAIERCRVRVVVRKDAFFHFDDLERLHRHNFFLKELL